LAKIVVKIPITNLHKFILSYKKNFAKAGSVIKTKTTLDYSPKVVDWSTIQAAFPLPAMQIIKEMIVLWNAEQVIMNESSFGEYKRNRIIARSTSIGVHNDHLLSNLREICAHRTMRLILLQLTIRQGFLCRQIRNEKGRQDKKSSPT